MDKPINIKINVKPIFPWFVHSGIYVGPCRPSAIDPSIEEAQGKKSFEEFVENIKKNLPENVEVLEPVYIRWKDNWIVPESELKKLEKDEHKVDLYLIAGTHLSQYPAVKIAMRYKKPIAMIGQIVNIDAVANLRSRGIEAYALVGVEDLKYLLSLLRVRKAFQNTKLLIVNEGDVIPRGVLSSVKSLEDIKTRFGIDYRMISSLEVFQELDNVEKNEDYLKRAEEITDDLIRNSKKVHMKREYIIKSVSFYLAIKNLLNKYESNAFTIPCFELCAKRIPEKKEVTFCLTHVLLKDEGYPSACEGDVNVLLSIALLMYLSRKSVYMGNAFLWDAMSYAMSLYGIKANLPKVGKNIMAISHDVPGLKMKGFDKPTLPYEIRNFTSKGWGATIRYDFSLDKGEVVTMARFNPDLTKLLIVKGEIVGSIGFSEIGCTLGALVKVKEAINLYHKMADFGHHLAMVYGNYIRELKDLGKLMGLEVIEG